ncbi:hypothetical protein JW998_09035 [candidate division KSB1 bacterium]|nr:hypothetical protein [candidate division KSB1 bacterium]
MFTNGMTVFCICVLSIYLSLIANAEENDKHPMVRIYLSELENVTRDKVDQFRNHQKENPGSFEISAVCDITSETRSMLKNGIKNQEGVNLSQNNDLTAWRLLLYGYGNIALDESAKQKVIEAWNDNLCGELYSVPQISALRYHWNRDLLTDKFWDVLQGACDDPTSDTRIVEAYRYAIYSHANTEDLEKIKSIAEQCQNPQKKAILENTIMWCHYAIQPRNDKNPGPALRPPDMPLITAPFKVHKQ